MRELGMLACGDGVTAAAIVVRESEGLQVRAVTRVLGMGCCEYELPVAPGWFDEVRCRNNFSGEVAWVALRRKDTWWIVRFDSQFYPLSRFVVVAQEDGSFTDAVARAAFVESRSDSPHDSGAENPESAVKDWSSATIYIR